MDRTIWGLIILAGRGAWRHRTACCVYSNFFPMEMFCFVSFRTPRKNYDLACFFLPKGKPLLRKWTKYTFLCSRFLSPGSALGKFILKFKFRGSQFHSKLPELGYLNSTARLTYLLFVQIVTLRRIIKLIKCVYTTDYSVTSQERIDYKRWRHFYAGQNNEILLGPDNWVRVSICGHCEFLLE